MAEFSDLLGKILTDVNLSEMSETATFTTTNGEVYSMYHSQDCCERVNIEDICGDVKDLVGSPILIAEEATRDDPDAGEEGMWTFYKLGTIKGYVTIRWYGTSNGYYSVGVSFRKQGEGW